MPNKTVIRKAAQVDVSKCVGCKTCERHCPTGALKVREGGKAGYVPPCTKACPAGINVQGYISLVGAGDYEGAYRLIRRENPFPSVCGRVCGHPCQFSCNRKEFDDPVAIRDIKRFAADKSYENGKFVPEKPQEKNGKKIAVIGAGPSGLSCAYYLVMSGYEVDVFESEKVAGGILYYGIPEYRLPKNVLARDIQVIEDAGVNIHLNTTVGKDIFFDDLKRKYHAVYVAVGTQFSRKANIPGEEMPNVYHGLDFLRSVNSGETVAVGKKVVVIGGGNTAIDASRTALRLGAESVTILYRRRRTDMPAEQREQLEAYEEGVRVVELAAPVEILGDGKVQKIRCQKMAITGTDEKLRRVATPVANSEFEVEADTVIVAVSQYSDFPFINKDEVVVNKLGQIVLDSKGMTTEHYVFAGGDVVRGSATAVQAIADGKKAAYDINAYLGAQSIIYKGEEVPLPAKSVKLNNVGATRMQNLPIGERVKNNDEVALGLTEEQIQTECSRCMGCEGTVSVDASLCFDCDLCWELCPHDAIHFKHLPETKIVAPKKPGMDRFDQIVEICKKAYVRPLDQACQCTQATMEDVVNAILDGARSLRELYLATGIGGGCGGGYCAPCIYRLFQAAGYPLEDSGDDFHYSITQTLPSIPPEAGDHDPILGFREQQKLQWNEGFFERAVAAYRAAVEARERGLDTGAGGQFMAYNAKD